MSSRQARIQEDTYFRVMHILQENPDLTQRELAARLGVRRWPELLSESAHGKRMGEGPNPLQALGRSFAECEKGRQ